ncbi:MAG: hypothetical protein EOP34_06415 [Rickettsiales bacterium]|nr:MAG: hypothetical protein EOP34_06415 [Rickettsiales bacterium]
MTNLIIKHINNISKIADIYSGVGTYSFPLSEFCRVDMFEGNKSMIDSIRKVQNDKIRSFVRNLHNDPLIADELNNYDAVVINPPRNGSSRQIEEIKKSKLNKIFMIYCSHKTFKRDSKILIDSGFVIISANLIDQFYYTDHFEIFAYLQRNKN